MAAGTSSKSGVKREWDASEIEPSDSACIHGIVTDLSPVKKGQKNEAVKYFLGELSDGKKFVRVISFDTSLQSAFKEASDNAKPVALSNCHVKPNRDNPQEMEIILNNHSKINTSPKKFTVDKTMKLANQPKKINLSEISDLTTSQVVSVVAKVTQADEPTTITTKSDKTLTKQDVHIADATGSTRLVLWENDVSSVEVDSVGNSYVCTCVCVHLLCNVVYCVLSVQFN